MLIFQTWALVLTSPLALYGVINSGLPYSIPFLFTRNLKDQQFKSAFRIVLFALVTFPLLWLLQTGIVWVFSDLKIAGLYVLSLPFTGYFTHRWARWWGETVQQWKLR
ncbi:MAG: hypothetical protein R2822_26580 [Spirosomataceae bacterium]